MLKPQHFVGTVKLAGLFHLPPVYFLSHGLNALTFVACRLNIFGQPVLPGFTQFLCTVQGVGNGRFDPVFVINRIAVSQLLLADALGQNQNLFLNLRFYLFV